MLNEPVPPVLTEFLAIPGLVPNWPPGLLRPDLASTFLVNEAKGYVAAYNEIHAWDTEVATTGQPAAFVGFANNMVPARPSNPANPLDVQAADAWNNFFNRWFPNAVIDGWVDANLDGIQTPDEIHPEFVGKVDFMGVQYYGSQPMQGFGLAPIPGFPFLQGLPIRCQASSPTCSDFNQDIDPGGFREVLETAASYGVPLWVTENGIADAGDSKRPPYLINHIAVVQDLIAHDDMDILGYTYWSFVDNLEWVEGYDLEFGLYGSDPTTPELERTPKHGEHRCDQRHHRLELVAAERVADVHPGRRSEEPGFSHPHSRRRLLRRSRPAPPRNPHLLRRICSRPRRPTHRCRRRRRHPRHRQPTRAAASWRARLVVRACRLARHVCGVGRRFAASRR